MSLYRHLGRLFYAISAADGRVRKEEKETLMRFITKHWLDVDDYLDQYNADCAHYIGMVFEWLLENPPSPEESFNLFVNFRKKHPSLFPKKTRDLIWKTADSIATSYAGRNKSELVMLQSLRASLNDDPDKF